MGDCSLSIGGLGIRLESDFPLIPSGEFLPFLADSGETDVRAVIDAVEEIPPISGEQVYREDTFRYTRDTGGTLRRFFFKTAGDTQPYAVSFYDDTGVLRVRCRKDYPQAVAKLQDCFVHLGIEELLIRQNRICLHAACVQTPLGGILFSGPSGIGKSTQADLWCRHRNGRLINGDRPILSGSSGKWQAWGSPYAGSSRCYRNESCPVSAIVMLEQGKECTCRRLTKGEAFRAIWSGVTVHDWDSQFAIRAMDLVTELIEAVPVFRLRCTAEEEAVVFLEKALREEC